MCRVEILRKLFERVIFFEKGLKNESLAYQIIAMTFTFSD